ncbi:hypothetical protein [Cognatiyoonia sp. IB215182]|uniref:hypothetical protein n=1 Tax=Cognatiyoonia sp. IB215182 TaxID=3097353 RepID=UPI002A16BCA2|nr:hypothetical protein [Cognatiyoonia sp. IB215182]MDX8350942.1 hypothetical protein [Cognatiyoonia sp. IB215182]
MARRSKEEVIAEIKRLYECFDDMIDQINTHGPVDNFIDKSLLIPLSAYLDGIENREFTASEALSGIKEGVNGNCLFLLEYIERDPDAVAAMLKGYQEKTGRDYWTDAGDPKKAVKAILKRGYAETEDEYYLIKEVVCDVDNSLIANRDRPKAERIMDDFEQRSIAQ